MGFLKNFGIFDPSLIQVDGQTFLDEEQQAQLKTISETFPGISHSACQAEWLIFREVLLDLQEKCEQYVVPLKRAAEGTTLPNLRRIAHVAMVLPVSTADCERGFSAMKRIKTKQRNRLIDTTLNNLMMITLEGPSCQDMEAHLPGGCR
ncbi:hypothetical protein CAPTEDRAFT_216552 [Capitella teleta]|uniref:HAT C-terminal dimerisation domain-containing protein n=1 Tax=Capitella teleta TaxID=283909 RepID=R7TCI7_CAPTE|nr:hypothetical protein CAPTEDRAFT_216552 [Capitella teleta]|eukprot:ELT88776.1 hypothetical protein CAPTEDRAFT_216552 [Capitella teleta]